MVFLNRWTVGRLDGKHRHIIFKNKKIIFMKNSLTMILSCKPYVKRFIEQNFGNPADFSRDDELYDFFRSVLRKNNNRQDRYYSKFFLDKYSESIRIKIADDDFYRYGWEISMSDMISLNKKLECRVKILAHTVISSQLAFGFTISSSVGYFQVQFEFPEDIWKKESIIKECQRNMMFDKKIFQKNIVNNIHQIIVEKLSTTNLLSKKASRKYLEMLSEKRTTLHNTK